MGSGLSIQIQLERNAFFPGSLVRGVVIMRTEKPVEVRTLNAVFLSEMHQRWSTGSGKNRRHHHVITPIAKQSVPLFSPHQRTGGSVHVQPGQQQIYPFAFQLSMGAIPTVVVQGTSNLRILSQIAVEADVAGGFNRSGQQFITILTAVPAAMHMNPCPRQEQTVANINCCCCISKGSLTTQVAVDRSLFSLDRDQMRFTVRVINTSKADVESVKVSLVAQTRPKVGRTNVAPSQEMFAVTVPCRAPSGGEDTVQGVLRLGMLAPPSIMSNVLDVEYHINLTADTGCCVDNNTTILKPVLVAHTVDMTQFAAQTMLMYQAAPQIVDPNAFNSTAGYGAQNLYHTGQVPVWQPGMPMMMPGSPGGDPSIANQQFSVFAPPPPQLFEQHAKDARYTTESENSPLLGGQ